MSDHSSFKRDKEAQAPSLIHPFFLFPRKGRRCARSAPVFNSHLYSQKAPLPCSVDQAVAYKVTQKFGLKQFLSAAMEGSLTSG